MKSQEKQPSGCEQTDAQRPKASRYFHNQSHNWNCAQSVYKAQQPRTGISDADIELRYRSQGGGRAEGGMCGAVYAASTLVGQQRVQALVDQFRERAGGLTCRELKGKQGLPCSYWVDLAEEILIEHQQNNEDN